MEKQPTLFEPPLATASVFKPAIAVKAPAASGIKLNRSVPAADRERLTNQAIIVYKQLLKGSVTTGELVKIAAQYNARIKELRDWLKEFGWTIDKISSKTQANNTYAIRPFHGSKYQAMLMKKNQKSIIKRT